MAKKCKQLAAGLRTGALALALSTAGATCNDRRRL